MQTSRIIRFTSFLLALLIFGGCSSEQGEVTAPDQTFESGQRVWIDPHVLSVKMGGGFVQAWAHGHVIETKDKMVQVQIDDASTPSVSGKPSVYQPGAAPYVPASDLSDYIAGKAAHEKKAPVYADIGKLIDVGVTGNFKLTTQQLGAMKARAEGADMPGTVKAVSIYQHFKTLGKDMGNLSENSKSLFYYQAEFFQNVRKELSDSNARRIFTKFRRELKQETPRGTGIGDIIQMMDRVSEKMGESIPGTVAALIFEETHIEKMMTLTRKMPDKNAAKRPDNAGEIIADWNRADLEGSLLLVDAPEAEIRARVAERSKKREAVWK